VQGIAKAGRGKAELILGNENLENKVIDQLQRALQPALTNVSICIFILILCLYLISYF
jgi:hypothetical protein